MKNYAVDKADALYVSRRNDRAQARNKGCSGPFLGNEKTDRQLYRFPGRMCPQILAYISYVLQEAQVRGNSQIRIERAALFHSHVDGANMRLSGVLN